MTLGVDFSYGRPKPADIKKAGYEFVCRYLSHDPDKDITREEASGYVSAGLGVVVVWETTAARAKGGAAAGIDDAHEALARGRNIGMPIGRPIFSAVDWDAAPEDQFAINQYWAAWGAIVGKPHVGGYGGYWPLSRAFDAKVVAYGWQTSAWSGGNRDHRAGLYQTGQQVTIDGVQCDVNVAELPDYGQWYPPVVGGNTYVFTGKGGLTAGHPVSYAYLVSIGLLRLASAGHYETTGLYGLAPHHPADYAYLVGTGYVRRVT